MAKTINEALTEKKFSSIPNEDIKRAILGHVDKYGYQGGYYTNGASYRPSSTVVELKRLFDDGSYRNEFADIERLHKMDEWVANQPASSDFLRKAHEVWEKEHLDKEDLAVVAAFCKSFIQNEEYLKRQEAKAEKEKQRQEKIASSSNSWAGKEGDQVEFVISSAKIIYHITPSYYNAISYPVWQVEDGQGRLYTWGDTSGEVELKPGQRIHARIKKLREYRGMKETQLWKLSIIAENQPLETFGDYLF